MQFLNTYKIGEKWGKYIVQQARTRLTKGNKNVDKKLYNSLKAEMNSGSNGFDILVSMLDYGKFQDRGVRGKNAYYADIDTSSSPYQFGSKMPPIQTIADWAKKRNIRLRNDKGQFAKGNYNSIGYVLARGIQDKGIKASMFLTRSYRLSFAWVEGQLLQAIGQDVADDIRKTARQVEKNQNKKE